MKWLEQLAMNFLLKRGYQVTLPMVYFSGKDYDAWGGASYWTGKVTKTPPQEQKE